MDAGEIVAALSSGDPQRSAAAGAALASASLQVEAAVTKALARTVRLRDEAGRHACCAIADGHLGTLSPAGWNRLFQALARSKLGESTTQPAIARMMARAPNPRDRERTDDRKQAKRALWRRLVSVFGRSWVIPTFWIPMLFVVILLATTPEARVIALVASAGFLLFVIALDGLLRRCPSCRRWLAGVFLKYTHAGSHTTQVQLESGGYADQTVNSWDAHWQCAHCDRRWQT